MSARPKPENFETRWSYHQAKRVWLRDHGGRLVGTLAIAVFFGALTGSVVLLGLLVAAALGMTAYARSRP